GSQSQLALTIEKADPLYRLETGSETTGEWETDTEVSSRDDDDPGKALEEASHASAEEPPPPDEQALDEQ
mgnify:CR=1